MMASGVGLAVGFLVNDAGGAVAAFDRLRPEQLQVFGELHWWRDALALFLPTMLLLMGEANMYQKFFSARDEGAARRAVVGWIAGTIVLETLIVAVGAFGSISLPGLDVAGSETIVMRVAVERLPAAFGLMLICGAAAIIISTANSFLLAPASAMMRDIYQPLVNPQASDRQVVLYTRAMVVALGALGLIALQFFETILAMAIWAYTMYGAGVTPALLAAFLWRRATRAGGVASIATGMMVTLGWEIAARPWGIPTVYPAVILSVAALVVASLVTKPPTEAELAPLR
jgi:SSS family solute:Na+ symporter/sodium/proline symporter